MARVIVIGSGIAGLTTAIRASARHEVTLVTKAEVNSSNTWLAQGGIAGVLFDDDDVEDHIDDTLRAAAGIGDARAVRVLCTEGPARIRELIALGVPFDQQHGVLARGLEAAHSFPRVLHAGGDATGAAIGATLAARLRRSPVLVLENTFLLDLLVEDDRVTGVSLVSADGLPFELSADAVVLATGGAGQLYAHTSNPPLATGDGVAAALRAGARLADLEFYQFHPTTLADGGFLVSEAVRGEGALLRNSAGERFLQSVHPAAELAPRDVVARAMDCEMQRQGGAPVLLDASSLGAQHLAERFPGIDAALRARGIDWARQGVAVTPAAHYWMGGIATDLDGRSTLPGLFAVGEAARTGVHGANRLASNSLLEGVVFGTRAAAAVGTPWPRQIDTGLPDAVAPPVLIDRRGEPDSGLRQQDVPVFSRVALQELMWSSAGLQRDARTMAAARATLDVWAAEAPLAVNVRDHEDRNLLLLARAILAQAGARRESRGAHYRRDLPGSDERQARSRTLLLSAEREVAGAC